MLREPFVPPYAVDDEPAFVWFEITQRLDSLKPGQNFSIGNGFGIAVLVESTERAHQPSPMDAEVQPTQVCIDLVRLDFAERTINDEVTA